jgi:predicted HD phosphohydrolase
MNPPDGVHRDYFDELTRLEDALRCVQLAHEAGADDEMLVGALLRRIGDRTADAS